MTKNIEPSKQPESKKVAMVGLGHIGSNTAPQIARMSCVGHITLIDPDYYELDNLQSQAIDIEDVGCAKVKAVADRIRRINPDITVEAICARVETVPLDALRSDLIVAGLDSLISRMYVNQVAWRLGVPWIDAAVDGASLLARVNVYLPGPDAPCLECAWDEDDYAALEQVYKCDPAGGAVAATNAPAGLGAVTGGVLAIEAQKLLAGQREDLLDGRQVMLDLRTHNYYVTRFLKNSKCRFDHETWEVEMLPDPPENVTIEQALALNGRLEDLSGVAIRVEGHWFARMQFCPNCGNHTAGLVYLAGRIPPDQQACADCGEPLSTRGFDMTHWLGGSAVSGQERRRTLSNLGLRPGDIVSIRGPDGTRHVQFGEQEDHKTQERKGDRHERLGV